MRSVDLFTGCGGLALGLANAGFKHEMVVEYDLESVKTLHENKRRKVKHVRHWGVAQDDTRNLSFRGLQGVHLMSGGPPCQPFSIGGKHLGPLDARNMWPEAIRAIDEMRPKAFILENVRGLLRPAFSDYLEYISLRLAYIDQRANTADGWQCHLDRLRKHRKNPKSAEASYRILVQAVNAADYGAPQKRHRAIVIGIASDFGDDWEFPRPTHSQEALAWSKHVVGDYWTRFNVRRIRKLASKSEEFALRRVLASGKKPAELPWRTVRDAIHDLPPPTKRESIAGHWQHPGARTYPKHTGSCLDEPAKALKAGDHGVPGGENMLVNRLGNVRYFTVREMARLQGFPDDFVVTGSWKAATRQLGNAVPTSVGEYIGKAIRNIIHKS